MTRRRITLVVDDNLWINRGFVTVPMKASEPHGGVTVESVEDILEPIVDRYQVTITHTTYCDAGFSPESVRVALERHYPEHDITVTEVTE